jgi:capsular exopolysaccharide synthesis family protein
MWLTPAYNPASMAVEALPADDTIWLGQYLGVLRHRKWSIIIITLFAVLLAVLYTRQQTKIYESTARVQATSGFAISGQIASVDMETETSLVTSDTVQRCATLLLDYATFAAAPTTTEPDLDTICSDEAVSIARVDRKLDDDVIILALPQSNVLTIGYDSPNPRTAQATAQAFALSYIYVREGQSRDLLERLKAPLVAEQDRLSEELGKVEAKIQEIVSSEPQSREESFTETQEFQELMADSSSLTQQLTNINQQLLALDPSRINPPLLVLPAQLPVTPVSPDPILNAAVGLAIGLLLGIGLAFLRERLDDSLRGRNDLEQHVGAPVLAVIPRVPGWRNKHDARLVVRDQPKGAVAEAYRTLRTSISFMAAQRGAKVIMVVSPAAGDGKTTTAANLALVLADAGRRVVLVSADLRKPRLHRFFGLQNETGLATVLAGEAQPWETIQDPGIENLRVLLSGPVPHRPAELLQSEQMGEVLAGLREVADFVVVDTAPVLLVADALALAPLVDGVLFVADFSHTSRSAVAHAREQLDQVGAVTIGSILNNFDPAKAKAYKYYGYYAPYKYRYRYGYGYYGGYGTYGYGGQAHGDNGEAREQPELERPRERRQ